ncbi:hypothetical protein CPter291_4073 [Collimonas pratensis]|uniref:Uncharacterized protein n=1 Tax=Collimonas pratensis TaxID=279113 RepID=A0ABN4ME69_9BURK|nr:hypothetical protein CPter291_4073 [Collimonas pratensis]
MHLGDPGYAPRPHRPRLGDPVIPANAGIQIASDRRKMDPRVRGDDRGA